MKQNIKAVTTNYRYYINLTNDANTSRCIDNLKLNINNIIDCTINDKNQLVITTNQKVITGYVKKEIIKNYDNVVYSNMEQFINDYYSQITFSIVKSMYNSKKSLNYNAVSSIVENGYNDNLLDDLKQCVLITLWYNLKSVNEYSFNNLRDKIEKCYYWNNKSCDFVLLENGSLWLACYRAIGHLLYDSKISDTLIQHTKTITKEDGTKEKIKWYEPRKIAFETYDENEQSKFYTLDTWQYKEYLTNEYNTKATNNDVVNIWDIIDNVLAYIISHEKIKIYNGCKVVLYGLLNGEKITKISGISINTKTKYYRIIQNAYYELYKKPTLYNDGDTTATTTATAKISIDFSKCHIINRNNDILMDKVNKYHHDKKQVMYNKLFYATKYNYNSMVLRNRHNEKVYCKELQLDRK